MNDKYVLVIGDSDDLVPYASGYGSLFEVAVNFSQSPSVGVVVWASSRDAEALSVDARANGHKVGVYGNTEKARHYLYKSISLDPVPSGK